MNLESLKNKVERLLWEIPAVVIAVLLALALNTWKETKAEKATTEESLEAILQEVNENAVALADFMTVNQVHLDELRKLRDSIETYDLKGVQDMKILFEYTLLSDAAWETAMKKEINKYYGTTVTRGLAKIYSIQHLLDDVWNTHLTKITSVEFYLADGNLAMIEAHIQLLEIAIQLAETYQYGKQTISKEYEALIKATN
ncbi:MAG: hypothetical protein WBA74_07350 [Cyclobacteriaceae bacterium]